MTIPAAKKTMLRFIDKLLVKGKRSRRKSLSNRKRPAKPKRARSYFQARRRLFALVFIVINLDRDGTNQIEREPVKARYLLRRTYFFYISFENAVQNIIGRQGI